ncbi:hypothetical protein JW926_18390 [Candidatus Sumerlaeota bacterium]|nr:hypothetical protein [Candidatus Sumerlaeota bacterium]
MKIRNLIKKPCIRIIIILSVLFFLWFFVKEYYNIASPRNGSTWNQNENGIWLDRRWMREPVSKLPDEQLRQKLDAYKKRGIRYLFPHVCPMDEKGHLPEINHERVQSLLKITEEYGDFFIILPWVGGSIETVDLSNEDKAGYFDPHSENIRTAFHGIIKALKKRKDIPAFSGIAIYSDWTIDEAEWKIYDKCWLGE